MNTMNNMKAFAAAAAAATALTAAPSPAEADTIYSFGGNQNTITISSGNVGNGFVFTADQNYGVGSKFVLTLPLGSDPSQNDEGSWAQTIVREWNHASSAPVGPALFMSDLVPTTAAVMNQTTFSGPLSGGNIVAGKQYVVLVENRGLFDLDYNIVMQNVVPGEFAVDATNYGVGYGVNPNWDIQATATITSVPEPGKLAMLLAGLVGVAVAARPSKKPAATTATKLAEPKAA